MAQDGNLHVITDTSNGGDRVSIVCPLCLGFCLHTLEPGKEKSAKLTILNNQPQCIFWGKAPCQTSYVCACGKYVKAGLNPTHY